MWGPEIVDGVPSEGGGGDLHRAQRSTGYSASSTAKGASGQRLTYGTVAVNPNIIPYGTLMYITSDDGSFVYGYAYAADTGTAMMEGHAFVDLYYQTYQESVESAVVPVTVYIIDDDVASRYEEQNDAIRQTLLDQGDSPIWISLPEQNKSRKGTSLSCFFYIRQGRGPCRGHQYSLASSSPLTTRRAPWQSASSSSSPG